MSDILINKVANSGLITIDLESYYPAQEIVEFDLVAYLYMELILKEKDFRKSLKEHDWSQYNGKIVLVYCSKEAIIPVWAYMLVARYLVEIAHDVYQGGHRDYLTHHYDNILSAMPTEKYTDMMIVIKGCGDKSVPSQAYLKLTSLLQPIVKSIMYGEPCSTVPVYKKPRTKSI